MVSLLDTIRLYKRPLVRNIYISILIYGNQCRLAYETRGLYHFHMMTNWPSKSSAGSGTTAMIKINTLNKSGLINKLENILGQMRNKFESRISLITRSSQRPGKNGTRTLNHQNTIIENQVLNDNVNHT